jgi:predicted aspartyl protease
VAFQGGPELVVEGLLDSGFDGFLSFPAINASPGMRPTGSLIWTLADGSRVPTRVYAATARVVGIDLVLVGDVAILGPEVLIGRRFTDHFRVTFDHGREVVVEP